MCRLLAYKGTPIVLDKLLYQPKNSLITQSFEAKELEEPLNGDGFGVGWYVPELSRQPATFVSVYPAWNNRNLRSLAPRVKASCMFAHVRAASVGDVSEANCHPFVHHQWMMMHNGGVEDFHKMKRAIRSPLSDGLYNWIKGQTDSEHIFAYLLHTLPDQKNAHPSQVMEAFETTFFALKKFMKEFELEEPAYLNMVVTNGDFMVATRYVTNPSLEPLTLYHSQGSKYVCEEGICHMLEPDEKEKAVLIVSEKLTDVQQDWKQIPNNHFIVVDENLEISLHPITA
jgi:glutamine amidotransferase